MVSDHEWDNVVYEEKGERPFVVDILCFTYDFLTLIKHQTTVSFETSDTSG